MIRNVLGIVLLFLLPTVAYLGYALLSRPSRPVRAVIDETPFVWLAISGILLVFGMLIYYGWTTTTTMGRLNQTYTPARIKDGQIVPGRFE